MPRPPNIVYVVSHDTGRFMGCYGRPVGRFTPNLDRFAAESVRFDRMYCAAACCGPSRVCALTGLHSQRTGVLGLGHFGWLLPDAFRTTVDDLNDAGYETAHFGFMHERLYGGMRYKVDGTVGDERYWNCDTRVAVDNAVEFLSKRDRSRPFYINLATNETHSSHFSGVQSARHGGPVDLEDVWVPPLTPDTPTIRGRYAHWYASLRYFDHHFGRLLKALDDLQLSGDTLVVYTTDHGAGTHRGKGDVTSMGMEIAFMVRPPTHAGLRTGYASDALLTNIDTHPTLLEAAGLMPPSGLDGRSFWGLVKGEAYEPRREIVVQRNYHGEFAGRDEPGFYDTYDPQRGVFTAEGLEYIRYFRPERQGRSWYRHEMSDLFTAKDREYYESMPPEDRPRPTEELFDLRHDPWQQWDVAGRPEYAEEQARLAKVLAEWQRAYDDPALRPGLPPPLQERGEWPTKGKFHEVRRR